MVSLIIKYLFFYRFPTKLSRFYMSVESPKKLFHPKIWLVCVENNEESSTRNITVRK